MAKPLNERVASALNSNTIATRDLPALIAEVRAERDAQAATSVALSAEAVDFTLGDDAREEAATGAARASRGAEALETALSNLEALLARREESAAHQAKASEQKAAIAERDALAERFKTEYQGCLDTLIPLFQAVMESDERLKRAGLSNELSAEAVARDCDNLFCRGNVFVTRLTKLKLPALALSESWPAWPPRDPTLAGLGAVTAASVAHWEAAAGARIAAAASAG